LRSQLISGSNPIDWCLLSIAVTDIVQESVVVVVVVVLYFKNQQRKQVRRRVIYLNNVGEQGTHSPLSHVGPRGISLLHKSWDHDTLDYRPSNGRGEMRSGVPSAAHTG
jgi:hypothetical protein